MIGPGNIAHPIQKKRGRDEQITAAEGKLYKVSGFVTTKGSGEVIADVVFPVRFSEKPAFSFGAEMAPGNPLQDQSFPMISVVVAQWDYVGGDPTLAGGFWNGAKLAIVTQGVGTQTMIVHWHMEGKALRNPVQTDPMQGGLL